MLFLHRFDEGGVEKVATRLANNWAENGHAVSLVMGRDQGFNADDLHTDVRVTMARKSVLAKPIESLWMVPQLVKAVRRERPDVLFCAGNTYSIVSVLAKFILGKECPPILCKISNSLDRVDIGKIEAYFYRIWLRYQAKHIDGFVAMATPIVPEIEREMGVASARIFNVPDPAVSLAEIDAFRAVPREHSEYVRERIFLAVGRLEPQKNFPLLLDAFHAMAGDKDRLIILGEGGERSALETQISKLGLGDKVELKGHVRNVSEWLSNADYFVMSSDYEGLPAVLVEALAAALPIVTTNCSVGISALIDDGEDGLVVACADHDALSAAMLEITKMQVDEEEMRKKAELYTIEKSGALYIDALRALSEKQTMKQKLP